MRRSLRIAGVTAAGAVALVAVPLLTHPAQADSWTGGSLVVYRVGDGSAALTNAATPVFLDTFASDGSPAGSLALPTAATADGALPLTAAGQSRSEGQITTSADGHYLAVTGYGAAPGTTAPGGLSLTASSRTTVPRVVGIVDAANHVDTSTALTGAGAPTIIRSAVTDGSRYWATGDGSGILTAPFGGSPAVVAGAGGNLNGLTIQSGQLFTSGLVSHRLAIVGSGTPTTSASFADLPLAPAPGQDGLPGNLLTYGYAFVDRVGGTGYAGTPVDTLYVADASNRNGTLDKYSYNGTTWVAKGYLDVPGIQGLVAHVTGGGVELAITTPTELLTKTDAAAATATLTAGAPTHLASAPANTEFRGVALAPTGTNGPVVIPRTPADGSSTLVGSTIAASANILGAAATSVTFQLGSGPVVPGSATGSLWSANVPTAGLGAGATSLTVTASDGSTTRSATRTVVLTVPPPTVPAGAAPAGSYSPRNALFRKVSSWRTFATPLSPDHAGLYSPKKGHAISGTVYGNTLSFTFLRRSNAGKVYLTVDGKTVLVDLYRAKTSRLVKAYAFTGGLRTHTFTITVAGAKRAASSGKNVYVAAVSVR